MKMKIILCLMAVFCMGAYAGEKPELKMAINWLGADLDPTHGWNSWTLARCAIGENLVQFDENMRMKPVLADSFEIVDGFTTKFHIREGVKFHNGKKVDALACKESISRVLEISDRGDVKLPIKSMIADGQNLTIISSQPLGTMLNTLADPVYIIVDADAAESPEFAVKPVCTGAFKVDEYNKDKGMRLSAFDGYWNTPSEVSKIDVKLIKDPAARTMALQSGEIDYATAIPVNNLVLFNGDYTVLNGSNLRVSFIRLNHKHPCLSDIEFRKALLYGIDRKSYAELLVKAKPAKGPFTELLPFGCKGESCYNYDPEKAKELLDKTGYVDTDGDGIREHDGENISLNYFITAGHNTQGNTIGTAIKSQLKEIGIDIKLALIENPSEIHKSGAFDLIEGCWVSAPTADPQYFLERCFKTGAISNFGRYSSAELDKICDELAIAVQPEKRIELGMTGGEILMKGVAAIFLYYCEGTSVYNNKFSGIFRSLSDLRYIDNRLSYSDKQ